MFSLLLTLFTLCVSAQFVPQNCTLSQAQWLRFLATTLIEDPVPPITLCSVDSVRLMRVDMARMTQPWNAPWVAASHTYLTGVFNAWTASSICNLSALGVNTALLLLGDSLTQTCDNRSAWSLEPLLQQAHALLMRFNEGELDACVQCEGDNSTVTNATTPVDPAQPFYYYQEPDIVTLRLHDSNSTLTYSLLKGRWNATLGLTLLCVAQFLCICALLVAVALLYNPNKRFVCCLPESYHTSQKNLQDAQLVSQEGEDTKNKICMTEAEALRPVPLFLVAIPLCGVLLPLFLAYCPSVVLEVLKYLGMAVFAIGVLILNESVKTSRIRQVVEEMEEENRSPSFLRQ